MLLSALIIVFTIILLLFLLSMIWPPDSPWSPWWRTNSKVARTMVKLSGITTNDIIYDLGCGDGTLLITAARLKGAHGIGVEIDPSRASIARGRVIFHRLGNKVTIKRKNLFSEDISKATVVVVYLIPQTLKKLEVKFLKELKPGTRVISYVYPIDYLPKIAKDDKQHVTVYEIPKRKSA